jgi:hypothetical protein
MQVTRLLLHQHHLLHLYVRVLQGQEDLAFLQRPVEVDEMFRPGARGARLGKEVLLESFSLDILGIMFYVHPPKGALEICQSVLPRGDGAFHAIQLPIPGKELFLQLDG